MVVLRRIPVAISSIALAVLVSGCGGGAQSAGTPATSSTPGSTGTSIISAGSAPAGSMSPGARAALTAATGVPRFDHIVVVIEENKPYGKLVGTAGTPFLTALAAGGAVLTQSYAVTHPSEPNYLALFSGSTQGLTDDSCPHRFAGPNLAASLIAAGSSFAGYSESLPSAGSQTCGNGLYARKHNPWVNFALPASVNQPMTAFPTDFARLPTVSFVIPNLQNDMHDGSIAQGDHWLAARLGAYRTWAATHNSLLIVTTDEDDRSSANRITTIFAGAHVIPGQYATRIDHYGMLRTLLNGFRLAPFAGAARVAGVTAIWRP